MVWDLIMAIGISVAWVSAIRWAVRTDRASRASARVLEEAERVLREAAGSSYTPGGGRGT